MKISASMRPVATHPGNSVHAIETKMNEIKNRMQEIQEDGGPAQEQILEVYKMEMMALKELLMQQQRTGTTPSIPRTPVNMLPHSSVDISVTSTINLYA